MTRQASDSPEAVLPPGCAGSTLEEAIAGASGPVIDPLAGRREEWGTLRGLCAVLGGRAAIDPSTAFGIARWVLSRHRLTVEPDLLATLVREAVMNAAVHGNMALPGLSAFRGDFERYEQAIATQLADPAIAALPVIVLCRIGARLCILHILDCGAGYDSSSGRSDDGVSGRGLLLIRSIADHVRVSLRGRCLSLGLPRRETDHDG